MAGTIPETIHVPDRAPIKRRIKMEGMAELIFFMMLILIWLHLTPYRTAIIEVMAAENIKMV
jgi:hypothetical protein